MKTKPATALKALPINPPVAPEARTRGLINFRVSRPSDNAYILLNEKQLSQIILGLNTREKAFHVASQAIDINPIIKSHFLQTSITCMETIKAIKSLLPAPGRVTGGVS